ncbi:MAG: tlde1 domain-containing protein [Pseudomonadota bacterium]
MSRSSALAARSPACLAAALPQEMDEAPRLSLRLAGAMFGVAGIMAAALQSAGFIPHPGLDIPFARAAVEEVEDIAPAVFGPLARPLAAASQASEAAPSAPQQVAGRDPAAAPLADSKLEAHWAFAPIGGSAPFTLTATLPEDANVADLAPRTRMVPLPAPNPLASLESTEPAPPAVVALPPKPARSPLLGVERKLASLPPEDDRDLKPAPVPRGSDVALPGPSDRYAVYDITAKTVYMPNGERLEAHSGYGSMMDDPRYVSRRMRGPTPPNVYNLRMREALFHGVEAVRMTPVDGGKMFGRDGILAHTYMLGPRGDSNGCVSFADYSRFLAAFKRGEVKQMVVVAKLENAPAANPLLSWLMPR